jgi:hypothetical protein
MIQQGIAVFYFSAFHRPAGSAFWVPQSLVFTAVLARKIMIQKGIAVFYFALFAGKSGHRPFRSLVPRRWRLFYCTLSA